METTALYVEYIVIGMETLLWIFMALYLIIGNSFKQIISYCVTNLLPSIMMIILCYILGLVTDRITDTIFDMRKKNIKKDYKLNSHTSIAVWEDYSNSTYANFTLSRIRILRSTTFNSIIIGLLGAYIAYNQFCNANLAFFILVLFNIIFLGANNAHKNLLDNYYKKTKALENEKNKRKKKHKK